MDERRFSPAAERNGEPILRVLRQHCQSPGTVLEVGSGTGQHGVYFAAALPHLAWQPSDRAENLPSIRAWRASNPSPGLHEAIELDVTSSPDPALRYDYLFSANTLHIMSWEVVERFVARLPDWLEDDARVLVYGPFFADGREREPSNVRFDLMLREQDPAMGIRRLEEVRELFANVGFALRYDHPMPANNRTLVFFRER